MATNSQFHSAAVAISSQRWRCPYPRRRQHLTTYDDDDIDDASDNHHVLSEPSVASRNTAQAVRTHKGKGELTALSLALGCLASPFLFSDVLILLFLVVVAFQGQPRTRIGHRIRLGLDPDTRRVDANGI